MTVAVTVAVTEGIVLVMQVQVPPLNTTTHPKGLDAPSPMTSRTGPRGRSETTFVAVAVDRGRDRVRDRGYRACDTDLSSQPTPPTPPKASMDLRQQGQ